MGAAARPIDPFDEALAATRQAPAVDPFDTALASVRAKRPPLLKRLGTAVADMATRVDPETGRRTFSPGAVGETAKGIVTAPYHTLKTAGQYMGQTAAELTLPQELQNLAYQDPTRISERDAAFTAAQTALLGLPFTRAGKLLTPADKLTKAGVQTAYGAGAGAAFAPDDPAVGAILGGATGAAVSKVADAYTARRGATKAQAEATAARRTKAASGESVVGPIRRVPRSEVTPERIEDITYRPDPLAEHVVKPEAPKAPSAAESYPLGTTAEGSGPMFRLKRTAFATGQATRRPKAPTAPEPIVEIPQAAEARPPVVEPQGSPRVSAEWQAAYDGATPRQQAEMLAVRFRPNNAADPIVPTPAEFAKAQELIAAKQATPQPKEIPLDDMTIRRAGMPRDLADDIGLLAEERQWNKTIRQPGESVRTRDGTEGVVVRAQDFGKQGESVLVQGPGDAPGNGRWHPVDDVVPASSTFQFFKEKPQPAAPLESFSAGRDPKERPRIPPATELPPLIRTAQGKTGPGQYLDAATVKAMEAPLPEIEPATPVVREVAAKGPKNAGPKALYERLSDEALSAEYKALLDKQAAEQMAAEPPIWTEERNAAWVEAAENRRRGEQRQQGTKQEGIGNRDFAREEMLGQGVHTFESATAAKRVEARAKHLEAIERELQNRGKDPIEVFERQGRMVEQKAPSSATPFDAPDPASSPREYLNYAKFGLDQTSEARLRNVVDELRDKGAIDKDFQSFEHQRELADAFAKEVVADPLRIDHNKLKGLSGAQIVGLRRVVGENTRVMEGLSKAIESGQLTPDEVKVASDMIDRASVSTNEVLGAIVRETAQTARDLGFLRQMAKLSTDPEAWIVRGKKMLGDRPMTDRMMTEIRRLAKEAADACA